MTSSVASLLDKHFPGFLGLKLSKRKRQVEAVILFLFRGIGARDMNGSLSELCGNKKEFCRELKASGEIFKIKLFLYYCVSRNIKSKKNKLMEKTLKQFMVPRQDAILCDFVWKSDALRKLLKKYLRTYKVYTLQKFRQTLSDVSYEVEASSIKYARKKMSFISSSNGFDVHDLSADLLCNGLQAAMNMYPLIDSPLHLQNIIKRTIHNTGVNSIHFYTTQSRGTLVRERDGTFSSLKVSYDSLVSERHLYAVNDTNTDSGGLASIQFGEETERGRDVVSDTIAATQLLAKYKGRKQKLLYLMTGELDTKFTLYLRKRKIVRPDRDNEDFFHAMSKKDDGMNTYIEQAMEFLKMEPKKGRRFLKGVRSSLGGELH